MDGPAEGSIALCSQWGRGESPHREEGANWHRARPEDPARGQHREARETRKARQEASACPSAGPAATKPGHPGAPRAGGCPFGEACTMREGAQGSASPPPLPPLRLSASCFLG